MSSHMKCNVILVLINLKNGFQSTSIYKDFQFVFLDKVHVLLMQFC